VLQPTDEEVGSAVAHGKRVADYRWGTMWVSAQERYVSFAWKAWLLAIAVVFVLLFLVTRGRG